MFGSSRHLTDVRVGSPSINRPALASGTTPLRTAAASWSMVSVDVVPLQHPRRQATVPASRGRERDPPLGAAATGAMPAEAVRPPWSVPASPPPTPAFAIRRPRLEALLEDHRDERTVLVTGPVGAGKTVLITQWLRAHARPCAWVSVDRSDNDAELLLRHLEDAVARACEGTDGAGLDPGERRGSGHGVLRDVLVRAANRLSGRLVLVLDDVHRIDRPAAEEMLRTLVEHVPEPVQLVLISRRKPRCGLERSRLRGDLLEIPAAALRFEASEISALAATWPGGGVDVAELGRSTLGWAAGLRMAALAVEAHDDVARAFVREELIGPVSGTVRSFLEATCWLPVLTAEICAELTGEETDGAGVLRQVELAAIPLVPLASRSGAYRYPPLLARLLQHEFGAPDARNAAILRRRAADACRRAGELVASVELFLEAGCAEEAAEACALLLGESEASPRLVHQLLARFPDITFLGNDRLCGVRARAAAAVGCVDEARRWLGHAPVDGSVDPAADHGGEPLVDVLLARAAVAELDGDVAELRRCAELLLGSVGARPSHGVVVAPVVPEPGATQRAHAWRVRALVWSGDADGARAAARCLGDAGTEVLDRAETAADVAAARTWMAWFDDDVDVACDIADAARHDRTAGHSQLAELTVLAGAARRERNDMGDAVALLEAAIDLAARSRHSVVAALAAGELARAHLAAGRLIDALELVASTRSAHPDLPTVIGAHLRRTEARARLAGGDIDGAHQLAETGPPGVDRALLEARVALVRDPASAAALIAGVEPVTVRQVVERALLCSQLPGQDPDDVRGALLDAVAHGAGRGLVRTYLDEGPVVSHALRLLASDHGDLALGRLAAAACQDAALAPLRASPRPVEPLTSRELLVLRVLTLSMSNRDVAAELYISLNTLKSHVRAIYRKLDVTNRSDAIRRARALHLV
jgi:LuxR family transcriptional regulator, maltose regulon positive regulatory protein